jgi:hypothetical protein
MPDRIIFLLGFPFKVQAIYGQQAKLRGDK